MKTKAKYKLEPEQREFLESLTIKLSPSSRAFVRGILERGRYSKKQKQVLNDIRINHIQDDILTKMNTNRKR